MMNIGFATSATWFTVFADYNVGKIIRNGKRLRTNMDKKISYDWIVLKYDVAPNRLICERCGREQVLPEGSMPSRIFVAIGDAFTVIHKRCKKVNE